MAGRRDVVIVKLLSACSVCVNLKNVNLKVAGGEVNHLEADMNLLNQSYIIIQKSITEIRRQPQFCGPHYEKIKTETCKQEVTLIPSSKVNKIDLYSRNNYKLNKNSTLTSCRETTTNSSTTLHRLGKHYNNRKFTNKENLILNMLKYLPKQKKGKSSYDQAPQV